MDASETVKRIERIFHGRGEELAAMRAWVGAEQPPGGRAGLVVGAPGRGKSALLAQFARECAGRADGAAPWCIQSLEVTGHQGAAEVMSHLLDEMLSRQMRPVVRGPRDRDAIRALLESVPAVGKLLAHFVRHDTRPGWQKFLDFASELNDAVLKRSQDFRLVFIIDPKPEFALKHPGDWIPLAEKLPETVRLIVAQRPDDTLAAEAGARRVFKPILTEPLADLASGAIEEWYEDAFKLGLLPQLDGAPRRAVQRAAHERYGGYPLAHRALIAVLANDNVPADKLAATIADLPQETSGLLDELYGKLRDLGDEHHTAALALQAFSIPAPDEPWAKAAGLTAVRLGNMLEAPGFAYLFETVETAYRDGYQPFHTLFAERLESALTKNDTRRAALLDACWSAIEPDLTEDALKERSAPFFALMAAAPVALRSGDPERLIGTVNRLKDMKLRLGLLDEFAADMRLIACLYDQTPELCAAAYGNLGIVMQIRGDLDNAEAMHQKSLTIYEWLEIPKGMASQYGNLGIVMRIRGDLDGAEAMHRKALMIYERLEVLEGMARNHNNLGLVLKTRGDLDGAEIMYCKSLNINQLLGRLEGVASDYGNLGNVRLTRGDLAGAEVMHRKALEIEERRGHLQGIANAYGSLGNIMFTHGDLDGAEAMYRKALEIEQRLGRLEGLANTYCGLGIVKATRGDLDGAEAMFLRSLEINELLRRLASMTGDFCNLGNVMLTRGDIPGAREMWTKSRDLFVRIGSLDKASKMQEMLDGLGS